MACWLEIVKHICVFPNFSPSITKGVIVRNDKSYLQLDYDKHPAFSMYLDQCPIDATEIDKVFEEIDIHLRLLETATEVLSPQFVRRYFASQINPLINEILEVTYNLIGEGSVFYPLLDSAFKDWRLALQAESIYRQENKLCTPLAYHQGAEISKAGVALLRIPKEEIAKIWQALQPRVPEVLQLREKSPWEVASLPLPHEGKWWELVNDLLRESGALAALSHMHGCPMEPLNCGFIHSSPNEVWYKNCYADIGLPTAKTAYMHYDLGFWVPKMILYLIDVSTENGAFSIIPYGREMIRYYSQSSLWKYLDTNFLFDGDPRYETHYRRKRYHFPELRKELMRLPNQLRGTSHFGDDLVDGSAMSNFLLEREVVCTSDVANCILFDGSCTIHRGGLVHKGERWALQMGMTRAKHG